MMHAGETLAEGMKEATFKQANGDEYKGAEITEKLAEVALGGVEEQVPLSFPKHLVYPAQ